MASLDPRIESVIRWGVTAGGVWLVSKGIGDASLYQAIGGGVVALATVAWGYFANRPAAIAAKAQKIEGLNVEPTPAASTAVKVAVAETKAAGYVS